jgi:hypothetical protein
VGIGTASPSYTAHVRATSPILAIQDDTSAATGVGGVVNMLGYTSGTSGANVFAQIKGVKTSASVGGEFQVFTSDSAGNSVQRYLIDATGISTWSVGGSTAMTLNSTGLGVGGSPSGGALMTVGATSSVSATANAVSILSNKATFLITSDGATNAAGTTINYSWANGGQGPLIFRNAAIANVMTLDASGRLLVNTTSVIGSSGDTLQIAGKTTASTDYCSMYTGTSTTVYASRYYHTSAVVGSITFTASGTAYNIASDYRLKDSVQPLTGGLARINALKPSIYKWKVNNSNGEGFIAHELADVVPAAVTGEKDAVNEDGSIKPQQVDLSKIVPILVAAIQELTARVQTLEAR